MKNVTPDGKQLNKRGERHAQQLLALPRVQQAIAEKFAAAGLSTDDIVAEIAKIAKGGKVKAETRLRAMDMAVRMTTGYAPNRNLNVNANVGGDKFFDREIFGDGKPPEV